MSYLAVDKDNEEWIYDNKPLRDNEYLRFQPQNEFDDNFIHLKKGSIEKLIGKKITWQDEPVELPDD